MKYSKEELFRMLAKNLQKYIERQQKTPKVICKELNIPYPTFMQWAEGRSYPPNERISLLADYFGIDMNELIQENQQTACNVVRCRNCELYCIAFGFCEHFNFAVEEEDYCSFAVQRLEIQV